MAYAMCPPQPTPLPPPCPWLCQCGKCQNELDVYLERQRQGLNLLSNNACVFTWSYSHAGCILWFWTDARIYASTSELWSWWCRTICTTVPTWAFRQQLGPGALSLLVGIEVSWFKLLQAEFHKSYFEDLGKFVDDERKKGTVYPTAENVFSWTRACSVDDVKVVILGQDPYHGPNQAHGMAFSVLPGVPPPPSLLNMYKELESDIDGFQRPSHGYLMGWAKQGVLMLNAVLTVKAHQANSHKDKGWEKFTDATISYLNKNRTGLVFMLWGAYAQKKGAHIDKSKHHILKGVHPSPLSAHRGFFGCKHFSKCNQFLTADGQTAIDWADLPKE